MIESKSTEERRTMRSKTFPGIARAIAEQWTIQIAWEENLLDDIEKTLLGDSYMKLRRNDKDELAIVEEREQNLINYWKNK